MRSTDLEHDHREHAMHMSHTMPPKTAAAHMGHDRHGGHSVAMFRDKFWLTLILTLPIVAWSGEFQRWLGYTAPTFPASQSRPNRFRFPTVLGLSWPAPRIRSLVLAGPCGRLLQ